MWKVCQLLKVGRSHLSRSRNANNLSSPSQPSSSSHQIDSHGKKKHHNGQQPEPFTPSYYRLILDQNQRQVDRQVALFPFVSADGDSATSYDSSTDDENFTGENGQSYRNRRRRPDRDYEGWRCRGRCSFGEWLGYTTMVAATIHLSRMTVYTLPNNKKDKSESHEVDDDEQTGRKSSLFFFKDLIQAWSCGFVFRMAPLLFPDLFKLGYVLPPASRRRQLAASNEDAKNSEMSMARYDYQVVAESSSDAKLVETGSSSDDCAVQTDAADIATPFDDGMWDAGKRLATFNQLTDVGLEHAIGVDLLKRQLYDEAIDYLLGAARSGHAGALYNLGICYSRGLGVKRDLTRAVKLWRTAADQGHGLSKYQMGACHARGIGGLAMDFDRAVRYMEAAAASGVPEAQTYLAAHEYRRGRLESALEFLRQAVTGGDETAEDLLQALSTNDEKANDRDKSMHGYTVTFGNEAVDFPMERDAAAIKRTNPGQRRFWGSSSSSSGSEEDSLSPLSQPDGKSEESSSSVFFCDDPSGRLESKSGMKSAVGDPYPRIVETVSSLLSLGNLHRSRTAPDFRCFENFEPIVVTTGNADDVDER